MDRRVYTRPAKPLTVQVRRRTEPPSLPATELAEPLTVDRATECHVTPPEVAARMVDYLGPVGDYLTLEPSAGTGALANALLASGHSANELTLIERHVKLASTLYRTGAGVMNRCFLEYAEEARGKIEFPRIIMNPPFRAVRPHIAAALSLLGQGGHRDVAVLVALVPITFEHPEAERLETLPNDTFATAAVNTKIIRMERPA